MSAFSYMDYIYRIDLIYSVTLCIVYRVTFLFHGFNLGYKDISSMSYGVTHLKIV